MPGKRTDEVNPATTGKGTDKLERAMMHDENHNHGSDYYNRHRRGPEDVFLAYCWGALALVFVVVSLWGLMP
jgi:hypothetical protein